MKKSVKLSLRALARENVFVGRDALELRLAAFTVGCYQATENKENNTHQTSYAYATFEGGSARALEKETTE